MPNSPVMALIATTALFASIFGSWWIVYRFWFLSADSHLSSMVKRFALVAGLANGLPLAVLLLSDSDWKDSWLLLALLLVFSIGAALLGAALGRLWSSRLRGGLARRLSRGTAWCLLFFSALVVPSLSLNLIYADWRGRQGMAEYRRYHSLPLNAVTAAALFQELKNKRGTSYGLSGLLLNPSLPEENQLAWAGTDHFIDLTLLDREELPRSVAQKIASHRKGYIQNLARRRLASVPGASPGMNPRHPASTGRSR